MNQERIRDLVRLATEYKPNGDDTESPVLNSEKFAELIVQECAKVIDRGDGEMSSISETVWCNRCRDDILNHFGVKE